MKPRSYMALVLITIAVACSANARNELAKYIIKDDIRQFRTTIAALAKGEQLDLARPCDEYNNTLLHLAVQRGSLRFVKALMRYIDTDLGRYVYLQNCEGWSPLQVAVRTRRLKVLKYLIANKGGIDHERDRALLDTAAIVGDLACIKYLVEECGLDAGQVDREGGTPLHYAASKGNLSCMLYFIGKIKGKQLDLARPCDEYNNTLLHLAVQIGSLRFVKALMRHIGNDLGHYVYLPNCDKWNPLQVAVHTWALDLLKYLITKKGGIDHKRDRALLDTAAIVGDLACVKYLVEKCGLDVGQIDDDGGTPLHYAASKGNLSCMLYFIGKIKEENVPELLNHQGGRYNNSPLHCLVVSRELEDDPEKFRQVVEALQGNKSLLNNRGKLPLDLGLNNLLIDIDLLYDHDTVTNRDLSVESQCSKALE